MEKQWVWSGHTTRKSWNAFDDWGHVQAAIIQTIKQDKPLYNYFTILSISTLMLKSDYWVP